MLKFFLFAFVLFVLCINQAFAAEVRAACMLNTHFILNLAIHLCY